MNVNVKKKTKIINETMNEDIQKIVVDEISEKKHN
jgi:hypothetical protein